MKTALMFALALPLVGCALDSDETDSAEQAASVELNHFTHQMPVHTQAGGGGSSGNLTYHKGPTITNAHVVTIFWGSEWASGAGADLARSINNYVTAFGQTGEYNTITQYSGIQKSDLAAGTWTDTTNPVPTNATDALVQQEVSRYIAANGFDANAIYEVFLPSSSYSTNGTSGSCNAPKLAYCAYHGNFADPNGNARYASMPYPGCGGCQTSGFTVTQNFEHFISHETREAVTDPDGTGWYDRRGYEADDKCAWTPTPFGDAATGTNLDGSPFAYQYEWSNANSACVKTR